MKEFWNDRYKNEAYAYGTAPNDFLKENFQYFPSNARILTLAEGEGRNAVFLAVQGHEVSAVDQSEYGRDKALTLAAKNNAAIDYQIGDLNDYAMGAESWDGIVSISAHTPPATRKKVLSAVKEALKPGGVFLLEGYNKAQLHLGTGGPKEADMLFSLTELNEAFPGFEILHAMDLVREIQEGEYHSGKSSVVQFIARKNG